MAGILGPNLSTGQGKQYYTSRKRWGRPQAMVWANNPGEVVKSGSDTGITYPLGQEGVDFIVLSDHNRQPINMDFERIENRMRMINGNMRSYHVADKTIVSTSWSLLPSRSYQGQHTIGDTDVSRYSQAPYDTNPPNSEYTADGGAGGVDMFTWYRNTTGPMWVFLSYDNYENYVDDAGNPNSETQFSQIKEYGERKQMFFSEFSYSIEKRGLYDMWNISVGLEEV